MLLVLIALNTEMEPQKHPKNEWKRYFHEASGMNLFSRHIYLINMFLEETGSRKTRIAFTQILMKI